MVLLRSFNNEAFTFRCYKEIACFNQCCADIHLLLTPYDVLRLRHRLHLSVDDFLNDYVEIRLDRHPRFPLLFLKMNNEAGKKCPFVTSQGCAVYEDRPEACRLFPLGRAFLKIGNNSPREEKYFLVQEDHCLGFQEARLWKLEEWMTDQGVIEYSTIIDPWLEILTSRKSLGMEKIIPQKIQMFFMASYKLDKFRRFIFETRFLDLFAVSPDQTHLMATDEISLMTFAFSWLKYSLFGEPCIPLKNEIRS